MNRAASKHPLTIRREAAVDYIKTMQDAGQPMSVENVMAVFKVSRAAAYNYLTDAGRVTDYWIEDRPVKVQRLRDEGLSYSQIMARTGLSKSQVRYALRKSSELKAA